MKHNYTEKEILYAWNHRCYISPAKTETNLRAFLDALPECSQAKPGPWPGQQEAIDEAFLKVRNGQIGANLAGQYGGGLKLWPAEARLAIAQTYDAARPQSAEIANLKSALAESEKQFQDKVYEIGRLLDVCDKAQAELAALRQPILADDGRSLGQVLHEILDEGLSWDRLLKGDKEQCKLAAQAVVAAARPAIEAECLAQAVRRMEAVPVEELRRIWRSETSAGHRDLKAVRAHLIAAANGEGQVQEVLQSEAKTEPATKEASATFKAHGKTWTRHTPGDPMPCGGEAMVQCMFADGDLWNGSFPAKDVCWTKNNDLGDIIGWRYAAEATVQVPLGPEDVPPGSALRTAEGHWFNPTYATTEGVATTTQLGTRFIVWTILMNEGWQINTSIPDTGRWDATAWRPCSKPAGKEVAK